jgi:hypothetical protein
MDHLAITIEATDSRNSSSQGSWVWVDAFDVTPCVCGLRSAVFSAGLTGDRRLQTED